jgi:hypothetical protein
MPAYCSVTAGSSFKTSLFESPNASKDMKIITSTPERPAKVAEVQKTPQIVLESLVASSSFIQDVEGELVVKQKDSLTVPEPKSGSISISTKDNGAEVVEQQQEAPQASSPAVFACSSFTKDSRAEVVEQQQEAPQASSPAVFACSTSTKDSRAEVVEQQQEAPQASGAELNPSNNNRKVQQLPQVRVS